MTTSYIKDKIEKQCQDFDIVILKGFSPLLTKALGEDYNLLDKYVIEDNQIVLEKINPNQLMFSIIQSRSNTSICTIESFIRLCSFVNNLDLFNKQFCVLENNMFDLYPNPSNCDIPDFDSTEFEDTDNETMPYSAYYSFCINEDGVQKVQYINNYLDSQSCLTIKNLIEPCPFGTPDIIEHDDTIKVLSTKDGSLIQILERLYETMTIADRKYAVESEDIDEVSVRVLVQASKEFGCPVTIFRIGRDINIEPRQEFYKTLKSVWGYDSFRKLKIYQNLNVNHDVIDVSQGAIVETVVQQAEHAFKGEYDRVSNVLLTSPTGAGKSLLFQLSAIYLAEKYELLTIIISPLVALMTDQVEGLTGYDGVATINSNISAARKKDILNGIKEKKIHLLYLSPELLLSYSITSFIGERKLGLLVVDEAHTVTTWGRDFRVDYWFLGDYLRKAKRILKYPFPIFALTATAVWDPSGTNDMVFDTIHSLNMDPCIKFIGVVRRDNIVFEIERSNINGNYEEKRKKLTVQRIREALAAKRKTIVYFPFRRTVDGIYLYPEIDDIRNFITRYHAKLFPDEKILNAESFRTGEKPIMCATKAFGMGIDVSDISEVYHHAPTGCLSDYVQEIGRLARDPKITGIAKIDFSTNDFRYIRQLHGLSAIKPYQLIQVLKKLMAIYRINGEKRNMLISSDDFAYIFPMSSPDDVDQNLKSCLLLISNDLLNKLNFQSIIVRPKSLFSKCYVEVPLGETKDFYRLNSDYLRHLTKTIYIFDADKYWMEKKNTISFPSFKHNLVEGKIFKDFHVELKNKVSLSLHKTIRETLTEIEEFFKEAHKYLNDMSTYHHRISVDDMKKSLPHTYSDLKKKQFVETFRLLYCSKYKLGSEIEYCKIYSFSNQEEAFQLTQSGYESVSHIYKIAFDNNIHDEELCVYCSIKDEIIKLSEFLNSLGLADYYRQGGDQPAIFVRINNPYYLNLLIAKKTYKNDLLESIYEKYRFSERIFTYFFTTKMTDKQRWDFIEAYFLGASEKELLKFVHK